MDVATGPDGDRSGTIWLKWCCRRPPCGQEVETMTAKRCGHCNMRWSRCLCKKPASLKTEREPPNLDKTPGQTRLDVDRHAGSRVAYWMRWMRTTGIREGWTVPPEQNQSSQDQRRAYHGVDSKREPPKESKSAVYGSGAPAKTIGEGLNNPRDIG